MPPNYFFFISQKWVFFFFNTNVESCGRKMGVKFVRVDVIIMGIKIKMTQNVCGMGCFNTKKVHVRQQYLQKVLELCGTPFTEKLCGVTWYCVEWGVNPRWKCTQYGSFRIFIFEHAATPPPVCIGYIPWVTSAFSMSCDCARQLDGSLPSTNRFVKYHWEHSLKRNRQEDCQYVHDEGLYIFIASSIMPRSDAWLT